MYFNIWRGIDNLALQKGVSLSKLAQKAGLNASIFNKSKRVGADGRPRWLSTETLDKVLSVTHTTFLDFMVLCGEEVHNSALVPLIKDSQLAKDKVLDSFGNLIKSKDALAFPGVLPAHCYMLEVTTDKLQPFYRPGTLLLISPQQELRNKDLVIMKTRQGDIVFGMLKHRSALKITLTSFLGTRAKHFDSRNVSWMARIMWASQ
ncbi:MAG: helix-turn-helix transcriptional regulator [Alphaproteobacteria bacterium]|nr:helix-turn-helix transcriptional regulator [Alphaproteobacteria bacterium]